MVIDYNGGKVYIVCGTCQLVLGLQPTESGLLIQAGLDGRGFVDLDKIEGSICRQGKDYESYWNFEEIKEDIKKIFPELEDEALEEAKKIIATKKDN